LRSPVTPGLDVVPAAPAAAPNLTRLLGPVELPVALFYPATS
jgi:hypothetical protein